MLDGLLGHGRVLLLRYLPGGLHHADEVLVRGCAHGQVGVVVVPLLSGNLSIVVSACAIKVVEEIVEDLLASLAALKELGVHADIVDLADIRDVNDTRAVAIHHRESLVNHGLAARSKLVSNFKFKLEQIKLLNGEKVRAFLEKS